MHQPYTHAESKLFKTSKGHSHAGMCQLCYKRNSSGIKVLNKWQTCFSSCISAVTHPVSKTKHNGLCLSLTLYRACFDLRKHAYEQYGTDYMARTTSPLMFCRFSKTQLVKPSAWNLFKYDIFLHIFCTSLHIFVMYLLSLRYWKNVLFKHFRLYSFPNVLHFANKKTLCIKTAVPSPKRMSVLHGKPMVLKVLQIFRVRTAFFPHQTLSFKNQCIQKS